MSTFLLVTIIDISTYLIRNIRIGKPLDENVPLLAEAYRGRLLLVLLSEDAAERAIRGLEIGQLLEQQIFLLREAGAV